MLNQSTQKEILIVEDDKSLTFIYTQLLKPQAVNLNIANDGEQALSYLENHQPDLILLDMHVPFVSGVEILRHIKANPVTQHTSIFIVSADSALAHVWEDRVDRVFIKPFNLADLVKAVEEHQLKQLV